MPKIALVYHPGQADEVRYCIEIAQWPPTPPGAGPGDLTIPHVSRETEPGPTPYNYLRFERQDPCASADPEDIKIELLEDPVVTGRIVMPFNGGYVAGGPVTAITIKLL